MNIYDNYYSEYLGIENAGLAPSRLILKSIYREIPQNKKFLYPIIFTDYKDIKVCSTGNKEYSVCKKYYDGSLASVDIILEALNKSTTQYDVRKFRRYSIDKRVEVDKRLSNVLTEELIRELEFSSEFDIDCFIKRKSSVLDQKNQFVIIVDNQIAATAYISDVQAKGCNIVVYTDPKYRKMGYGKNVVAECINWSLQNEMTPVYLVEESNVPSISLAESLGMKCESKELIVTDRLFKIQGEI